MIAETTCLKSKVSFPYQSHEVISKLGWRKVIWSVTQKKDLSIVFFMIFSGSWTISLIADMSSSLVKNLKIGSRNLAFFFFLLKKTLLIESMNSLKKNFMSMSLLEWQHFPDSNNQSNFPSIFLKKDEIYTQKTVYQV